MKLEPCPFCGSEVIDEYVNETPMYSLSYYRCDDCYAEAKKEIWNTRPIEAKLHEQIKELTKEKADLIEKNNELTLLLHSKHISMEENAELWSKQLEAAKQWQREALPHLKTVDIMTEELETLIKQAEENEIPNN